MRVPIPLKFNPFTGTLYVGLWSMFDWFEELSVLTLNPRLEQIFHLLLAVFYLYVGFIILSLVYRLVSSFASKEFIMILTFLYVSYAAMHHLCHGIGLRFTDFIAVTILLFTLPLVQLNLFNHAT